GNILIEALVGGRRHPERLEQNDGKMVEKVYEDISKLMDLPNKPWFTKVLRPESGIPQLEMDHPALQEWLAVLEKKNPGLYACGFGWEGIGMNDMTKSAKKVAKGIRAGSRTASGQEKVKPVYF
ncbi:MAG: protoporphyrinogen oxidase, partial [Desulfobulbaceae bacterium]|nr:protoporphyrinogen oxidase [Desulfobulbaceae bacterium]